jgi:ubiquinone/menaquinone biosynthesis C-methylase UbiE
MSWLEYNKKPDGKLQVGDTEIAFFDSTEGENIDTMTVESFGQEWTKFSSFSSEEIDKIGKEYFGIAEEYLTMKSTVLDIGCGTGRWTRYVAPKVSFVEAIDPSDAVISAAHLLKDLSNLRITKCSIDSIPFDERSFDLVFSLGVLHHIPDTMDAMRKAASFVKKDGQLLVYLYYALDNRGFLFRSVFHMSNFVRFFVSKLAPSLKRLICDILAVLVYLPLITLAKVIKSVSGENQFWRKLPLSAYWNKSFNVIRNDSLDRFGTPLEQRFSKKEITEMMERCGLTRIVFSNDFPYWVAIGHKV